MSDLPSSEVLLHNSPKAGRYGETSSCRVPLPVSIPQGNASSTSRNQTTDHGQLSSGRSVEKVFYLAHDLNDSAIWRRVKQLRRGGADVKLAGFRRGRSILASCTNSDDCLELGLTDNGRPGRRISSVVAASLRMQAWSYHAQDCDIIIARGIEMLALGTFLQASFCRNALLVYECLDIHRLMVSSHIAGRSLRVVERLLLRRCSSLIISSPAFLRHYFEIYHHRVPPVLLWENRMLEDEAGRLSYQPRVSSGRPWKIGWFGIIRCERSLRVLQSLCAALPGVVEVQIKGRPTQDLESKIAAATASTPGLSFGGSYDRARDLPILYGSVHFTWAIDYFEEGANSEWLLPNRLYEGAGHGAVPLALRDVQTGRWMLQRGFGVLFGADLASELLGFFRLLDHEQHQRLVDEMNAVEATAFVQPDGELGSFVQRLGSSSSITVPATARRQ